MLTSSLPRQPPSTASSTNLSRGSHHPLPPPPQLPAAPPSPNAAATIPCREHQFQPRQPPSPLPPQLAAAPPPIPCRPAASPSSFGRGTQRVQPIVQPPCPLPPTTSPCRKPLAFTAAATSPAAALYLLAAATKSDFGWKFANRFDPWWKALAGFGVKKKKRKSIVSVSQKIRKV